VGAVNIAHRRDACADVGVLGAYARARLAPLPVGLGQRGQQDPLLELEVAAPVRLPEGAQVRERRVPLPPARALAPAGRRARLVVIARELDEGGRALHSSPMRRVSEKANVTPSPMIESITTGSSHQLPSTPRPAIAAQATSTATAMKNSSGSPSRAGVS